MRKSFLMLALAGVLVMGIPAAVDLTFEADDTNTLQYATFSGTTGNITGGDFASTEQTTTEAANDILNPVDGTQGTQSYKTTLAFDFDDWSYADPLPADRSFVRITDFSDRHVLSEPDASGGVGIYLLYDGAAGDIEVGISVREEPVNTGGNEVYETTTFQVLSGSPDWQYLYFPFSTIVSGPDNWGQAIALGDGVYDGGLAGSAPLFEAVHLRPIAGTTQAGVVFSLFIDDIHTGAEHTPLGSTPPPPPGINYASPFYYVISQTDMETALGASLPGTGSPGLAVLENGNVFVAQDPSSGLGLVGEFWEVDYNAETDTLNSVALLATEADIVAADASTDDSDLDLSGFAVSSEVVYMLDNQPTPDQLIFLDLSGPSPAISGDNLTVDTGFFDSEVALFPTLGTLVLGDAANNAFVQYDIGTGVETELISNATLASGTGGTPDIDAQAGPKEIPGTTDFVWWDEDFNGGTGNLYQVDQAGALTLLVDPATFPGGGSPDPSIANLEAASDGTVFAFIGGFASSGNGILVREDDGTLHFFDDATLEAGFGITVGDDDRGFTVRENAAGVDLFFGTDDTGGDVLVLHFPLDTVPTAVGEYALYR